MLAKPVSESVRGSVLKKTGSLPKNYARRVGKNVLCWIEVVGHDCAIGHRDEKHRRGVG